MNWIRRHSLLIFILILALTALACQGLTAASAPAPEVNTEAIVEQAVQEAVATVEARTPEEEAVPVAVAPVVTTTNLSAIDLNLQEALVNVYAQSNPSVVHIFVFDDLDGQQLLLGSGSGFVYDTEGHIVTNNHVVAEGDRFQVSFADGSSSNATLVGTDVDSDLGVIQVDTLPASAPPMPLGDSSELVVGQFVVAIGNPFGEAGSMSVGIISGLGRTLDSQRIAEGGGRYSLPEVIQTDAAINPGNSGGPLLNLAGEVVGVNSAILTRTGTNSGVGFSIPVAAVKQIVPNLIAEGSYTYPYIGIRMVSVATLELTSAELEQDFALDRSTGVYVTDVTPGSPAEVAGLIGQNGPGGDLIVAIDGEPVATSDELISYLVFHTEVGQTVNLTVVRNGEEITVPLTLGERP